MRLGFNSLDVHVHSANPLGKEKEHGSAQKKNLPPLFSKVKEGHLGDRIFEGILKAASLALVALLIAIGYFLFRSGKAALWNQGWSFLTSSHWDPVQDRYGVLPVVFGTVTSSFLALFFAAPLSVGVALFLTELAPRRIGRVFGFLVEMLAAIPSVVYGLWGIFVLVPWLRSSLEPFLGKYLGFLPFFQGPQYGVGMLSAGLVLAIMITPTIASVCREVFKAIPQMQREGALALGATQWETMNLAVLKSAKTGILGAVILGLGRALGETMAVTMVIGNRHEISFSLFAPGSTMASIIANEYAEATSDVHLSALVGVGFCLFLVTFIVNGLARLLAMRASGSGRKA